MHLLEIQTQATKAGDPESFAGTFPLPALVLEPFAESGPSPFDTDIVHGEESGEKTSEIDVTKVAGLLRPGAALLLDPTSRVKWLEKTDRNPFAGIITVGRATNNDLILAHQTISKLHAIFHRVGDRWFVQDRGSSNGTYMNAERLVPDEQRELSEGAKLVFGQGVTARWFLPRDLWQFCVSLSS